MSTNEQHAIHWSAGAVNSIPAPLCASVQAHAIRYTRLRVELVTCEKCWRLLQNFGVKLPPLKQGRASREASDDVTVYSLPKFQRRGVRND